MENTDHRALCACACGSCASASIASNNITPKGIQYLAKMLEKVQKLEVLLYGFVLVD